MENKIKNLDIIDYLKNLNISNETIVWFEKEISISNKYNIDMILNFDHFNIDKKVIIPQISFYNNRGKFYYFHYLNGDLSRYDKELITHIINNGLDLL